MPESYQSRPVAPNYSASQNEPFEMNSKAEELEREISILRTINAEMANIIKTAKDQERINLNQERAQLNRERRDMEQHFNAEHSRLEEIIHNERCQLAKERSALELKIREFRPDQSNTENNTQNNTQSDELNHVKEQFAALQRELEARYKSEADAAYSSQQRISRLEEELQKMKQVSQGYELTIAKLEAINVRCANNLPKLKTNENFCRPEVQRL